MAGRDGVIAVREGGGLGRPDRPLSRQRCAGSLVAILSLVSLLACSGPPSATSTPSPQQKRTSPSASASATARPPPQPCVPAQLDAPASGVISAYPVLALASGLDQPDDIIVSPDQLLVGEHGSGRISRVGGASGPIERLPGVVPGNEGLALVGSTLYVVDQPDDRVVSLGEGQVKTVFQLTPVPGLDGADGLAASGTTLILPDSPRGVVLFIDVGSGTPQVTRREGGFARPVGAWPLADRAVLIADENTASVVRLGPDGSRSAVFRGLRLADDVVSNSAGQIFAISITDNSLVSLQNGQAQTLASHLAQPQGLALDGAGNLIVSEYVAGRLDAVITSFKAKVASAAPAALKADQPLCVGLQRAKEFTSEVSIEPDPSYEVIAQPGTGEDGSLRPLKPCADICHILVHLSSGDRRDAVWLAYKAVA